MENLTKRQSEILDYFAEFVRQNLTVPTVRQISAEFGFSSTNATICFLKALEKKGYIKHIENECQRNRYILTLKSRYKYKLIFEADNDIVNKKK